MLNFSEKKQLFTLLRLLMLCQKKIKVQNSRKNSAFKFLKIDDCVNFHDKRKIIECFVYFNICNWVACKGKAERSKNRDESEFWWACWTVGSFFEIGSSGKKLISFKMLISSLNWGATYQTTKIIIEKNRKPEEKFHLCCDFFSCIIEFIIWLLHFFLLFCCKERLLLKIQIHFTLL